MSHLPDPPWTIRADAATPPGEPSFDLAEGYSPGASRSCYTLAGLNRQAQILWIETRKSWRAHAQHPICDHWEIEVSDKGARLILVYRVGGMRQTASEIL